jgi:hypothetical protein
MISFAQHCGPRSIWTDRIAPAHHAGATTLLKQWVALLLVASFLGTGASSAAPPTCTTDTSPVSNCNSLSISGSNLTIIVPSGVSLGGTEAIRVQPNTLGTNLGISLGAIVGSGSVWGIRNAGNWSGSISSITNLGQILGSTSGISVLSGTITTINNLQGYDAALRYVADTLPSFYNIIIANSSNYGKLSASTPYGNSPPVSDYMSCSFLK